MWQAPSRAYGAITGYDVMFADTVSTSNSSVVQNLVLKDRDQFFHVVRESDLPRPGGAPMIQVVKLVKYVTYNWDKNVICILCGNSLLHMQVRAKTSFANGIWSPAILLSKWRHVRMPYMYTVYC